MSSRDVMLASRLLAASRKGEDSPEAQAGGMFEAAFMLAFIPGKEAKGGK